MREDDLRLTYNLANIGGAAETHFFDFANNMKSRIITYSADDFVKNCHLMEKRWTSMFWLCRDTADGINVKFISIQVDYRGTKSVPPSEEELASAEATARAIYGYLKDRKIYSFLSLDGFGYDILVPVDFTVKKEQIPTFEKILDWIECDLAKTFKAVGRVTVRPRDGDNKTRVIGSKTNYAVVPNGRKKVSSKWLETPCNEFRPNIVLSCNLRAASANGAYRPKRVLEVISSPKYNPRRSTP